MDQSEPQTQAPTAEEGLDQQPPPEYQQPLLNQEPTFFGLRLSKGATVARIINCVGFVLFAVVIVYETYNTRSVFTPPPGMIAYIPATAVIDSGYILAPLLLLHLIPNCLGFCVKKPWTAYLWTVTNGIGTLLMVGWLLIVFSDEGVAQVRSMSGGNYNPGASNTGPTLRFVSLGICIVVSGLGFFFTMLMFTYAEFLEGQARQYSPEELANMGPPTGTPSTNQVQPIVSNYAQAQPPPATV